MSQGRIIIVSGPSGVGKGTILRTVMQHHESLHYSVSATSRPMRPEDREGVSYYFVSRERFEEMIAAGELLEHACYAGNYYGTPLRPVEEALARGESWSSPSPLKPPCATPYSAGNMRKSTCNAG